MHNIFSRSLARVLKLNFVSRFKSRCSVIAYYLLLVLVEQSGLKVLYLPTLIILCTAQQAVCLTVSDYLNECIHHIPYIRVSIINFKQGEGISKQNKTRQYYTDNILVVNVDNR